MDLQDQGVIDSGYSRHMTGIMSYLTDFEEIDGGYVAFGGNPKGGKIKSRGTIKSDNSDFENMYFVRELQFNLFSVSQMCDKKNSVLFNDTECIVLSLNFKLTDESHVLLKGISTFSILLGRKPALGFMRPFGYHVTILNTIDHLEKFDGKADEGFFVGYSINSKAFRVFNSRTRIVEENLHIQFSENTPNIAGSGPNWLFDIDALTKSMNYKPVVARNQSNGNAGTKACDDTGDDEKKVTEELGKEGGDSSKDNESNDQEKEDNVNSTNTVNAASTNEVNDVGAKTSIELPDDPNMPELEDIVYSDNDEDVGAEADMNNLYAFMPEVYVCQTPGFEDPDFPDRVYKVEKALYGLHLVLRAWTKIVSMGELTFFLGLQVKQKEDEIFISQDKYVTEILKNFGFTDVKTTSTPMETQKLLLKDEDGEEVDVHLYRSMIGSLMYLTSSRPDNKLCSVCLCKIPSQPKGNTLYELCENKLG
ncbi:putative ribonuclease H-like domain-containing protein [Tanacetum coccineum]